MTACVCATVYTLRNRAKTPASAKLYLTVTVMQILATAVSQSWLDESVMLNVIPSVLLYPYSHRNAGIY